MRRGSLVAALIASVVVAGCRKHAPTAVEYETPPAAASASPSALAAAKAGGPVEVTEIDVTSLDVAPEQIRVLGVGLNATRAEAEAILKKDARFVATEDSANPTRLYVYERGPGGSGKKGDSVLYFIWKPRDPKLARIGVFADFKDHLVGETKALLTPAAFDPSSPVRKRIGAPDESAITLDVPLASLKIESFFYRRRGIIVAKKMDTSDGSVTASFGFERAGLDFKSNLAD
jgi:hypothetical protein